MMNATATSTAATHRAATAVVAIGGKAIQKTIVEKSFSPPSRDPSRCPVPEAGSFFFAQKRARTRRSAPTGEAVN